MLEHTTKQPLEAIWIWSNGHGGTDALNVPGRATWVCRHGCGEMANQAVWIIGDVSKTMRRCPQISQSLKGGAGVQGGFRMLRGMVCSRCSVDAPQLFAASTTRDVQRGFDHQTRALAPLV